MFKLLASDQKEYGPVSADQIREWIAQGRANPRTKLQPVGAVQWKELGEFPEFANALRQAGFSGPPALPSTAGLVQSGATRQASGMAVASLVLGILGLL